MLKETYPNKNSSSCPEIGFIYQLQLRSE